MAEGRVIVSAVAAPAPIAFLPGARMRLRDRRRSVNLTLLWKDKVWSLSCGYDADCRVREVFGGSVKVGSEMEALLNDACIALSLLLQAGHSIQALVERFSREAIGPAAPAASILGLVAEVAAREERFVQCGEGDQHYA